MDDNPQPGWAGAASILEAALRYWLVIALLAVLGGAAGYLLAARQAPVYEASARLLLADPGAAGLFGEVRGGSGDIRRHLRNQVELIRSHAAYPGAAELLEGQMSPEAIASRTAVEVDPDVDTLVIRARHGTAAGAAAITNAVADSYRQLVRDRTHEATQAAIAELRERNDVLQLQLRTIDAGAGGPAAEAERNAATEQIVHNELRIMQLTTDATLFDDGVEVSTPATIPAAPIAPRPLRAGAVGLILAAGLAVFFGWWRVTTRQAAHGGQDPAPILEAPLLAEIADFRKAGVQSSIPAVEAPLSPPAEAFEFLLSAVGYASGQPARNSGQILLVTSPNPGDGKTVVSLNLALTAARDRQSVLLVDGDRRMRGLSKLCRATAEPAGTHTEIPGSAVSLVKFAGDVRLTVAAFGSSTSEVPATFFRGPEFRASLRALRAASHLVLIDGPPLLPVAETSAIAGQVDGIILVVTRGTPFRALEECVRRLQFVGAPLIGFVFNRASPRSQAYTYGTYGDRAGGTKAGNGQAKTWVSHAGQPSERHGSTGP